MSLTPNERTLRARLAAHVLHASVDSREHTEPARPVFLAHFEDRVRSRQGSLAGRAGSKSRTCQEGLLHSPRPEVCPNTAAETVTFELKIVPLSQVTGGGRTRDGLRTDSDRRAGSDHRPMTPTECGQWSAWSWHRTSEPSEQDWRLMPCPPRRGRLPPAHRAATTSLHGTLRIRGRPRPDLDADRAPEDQNTPRRHTPSPR